MSPGAAIDHYFDRVCEQPIETGYYLARRKLLATRGEAIEPLPTLESLTVVCPECGASFLSRADLGRHRWGTHRVIGECGLEKRRRAAVADAQSPA